jgi:hypothetical protein
MDRTSVRLVPCSLACPVTDHAVGTAFPNINKEGKTAALYPSVGVKKHGEHIRVNFGQTPFVFDIDAMMEVGPLHSRAYETSS